MEAIRYSCFLHLMVQKRTNLLRYTAIPICHSVKTVVVQYVRTRKIIFVPSKPHNTSDSYTWLEERN